MSQKILTHVRLLPKYDHFAFQRQISGRDRLICVGEIQSGNIGPATFTHFRGKTTLCFLTKLFTVY